MGLRQSKAEQRDAPGKPEAKFIAAAGPESWLVWQPGALSGHARTTATVFSGHLHYSKINALSILCLPALDAHAASSHRQPKGGLTSARCETHYKWNQMSLSMVQNYLTLHCAAELSDCRLWCRGAPAQRTMGGENVAVHSGLCSECWSHFMDLTVSTRLVWPRSRFSLQIWYKSWIEILSIFSLRNFLSHLVRKKAFLKQVHITRVKETHSNKRSQNVGFPTIFCAINLVTNCSEMGKVYQFINLYFSMFFLKKKNMVRIINVISAFSYAKEVTFSDSHMRLM